MEFNVRITRIVQHETTQEGRRAAEEEAGRSQKEGWFKYDLLGWSLRLSDETGVYRSISPIYPISQVGERSQWS